MRLALLLWAVAGLPRPALADLSLVMFDQTGCKWCARWEHEIGPAYPKTAEAALAPLTHINIHAQLPEDVRLARPAQFTPTFVLLSEGEEIGRIEGYPGADFFWPMLDELLDLAGTPVAN